VSDSNTPKAILRGFPPSNNIGGGHSVGGHYFPPTLNGEKPPNRYNVWLRRYYVKQFKKRLAAFGNN